MHCQRSHHVQAAGVIQHAAQTLPPLDLACVSDVSAFCADQSVGQTSVIAFIMVMGHQVGMDLRNDCSPNRIICSQQDSLMVLTNSAYAFKFGDRGGSLTAFTPTSASMCKKLGREQRVSIMDQIMLTV